MGKRAEREKHEHDSGVTGPRTLSFWDPGRHLPRRVRVRVAKRLKRRGGTIRDLLRIRNATAKVREFIDALDEHATAITDPEAVLRGAR